MDAFSLGQIVAVIVGGLTAILAQARKKEPYWISPMEEARRFRLLLAIGVLLIAAGALVGLLRPAPTERTADHGGCVSEELPPKETINIPEHARASEESGLGRTTLLSAKRASAAPLMAAAEPLMRVHFIDVGQGASTLFEFPRGAILVDTGGEQNADFSSVELLDEYLTEFFDGRPDLDRRLDSVILTHPHIDHTYGAYLIRDKYAPRNVVANGQDYGKGYPRQRALVNYAAAHDDGPDPVGLELVMLDEITATGLTGPVIDPLGPAAGVDPKVTVLWGQVSADPGWGNAFGKPRFENNNNHSVVVRVDFGEASVLVTGDLEDAAIGSMLQKYAGSALLDVDVYEAGHHGSLNGTTEELLSAMTPDIAVIEMGNVIRKLKWTAWDYGHPRNEVVELLEAHVTSMREPKDVHVGLKGESFTQMRVQHAIYAPGWDGNVVIEGNRAGAFRVLQPSGAPPDATGLVNINTARAEQLESLPTIGRVRALAIIPDRVAHGPFASLESLDRVPGIGMATIEAIRSLVMV